MATSPTAIRSALVALSAAAVAETRGVLRGNPDNARATMLEVAPIVTAAYVEGSSALAADWYEELREEARPRARHLTIVPAWQRAREYGNALAWATEPLTAEEPDFTTTLQRVEEVTAAEVFTGFTDTTDRNVRADAEAVGWKRVARLTACPFCQMLADRGAVYRKQETANFPAHTAGPRGGGLCQCTIVPVFKGGDQGPEASVVQYAATKRRVTERDRERLRNYLKEHYGGTYRPH